MQYVSLEEAMAAIHSGNKIYVQGMASTPHHLLEGIAKRGRELENVTMYHLHMEGPTPWIHPDLAERIRDISLFVGQPVLRQLRKAAHPIVRRNE